MKRICSACKKELGEKCGKCGSLNIVRPILVSPDALWCDDCGHYWIEGTEPLTHGLCEECLAKATATMNAEHRTLNI